MTASARALALALLCCSPASAQTSPASPTAPEPPVSPEIATCKAAALKTLQAREPQIKDIYVAEEGATIAVSDSKIGDIPVRRIVMSEAYLRTDKSDTPRRFLCLIGEENRVLLTFFTAR
jgi:hypothetical protein